MKPLFGKCDNCGKRRCRECKIVIDELSEYKYGDKFPCEIISDLYNARYITYQEFTKAQEHVRRYITPATKEIELREKLATLSGESCPSQLIAYKMNMDNWKRFANNEYEYFRRCQFGNKRASGICLRDQMARAKKSKKYAHYLHTKWEGTFA